MQNSALFSNLASLFIRGTQRAQSFGPIVNSRREGRARVHCHYADWPRAVSIGRTAGERGANRAIERTSVISPVTGGVHRGRERVDLQLHCWGGG